MGRDSVGELEHLILLGITGRADGAGARTIRSTLEDEGRSLTRGALYRSLDRLADKGLISWQVEDPDASRGGHSRRVYTVTDDGRAVLMERRATLERLWNRAAPLLGIVGEEG